VTRPRVRKAPSKRVRIAFVVLPGVLLSEVLIGGAFAYWQGSGGGSGSGSTAATVAVTLSPGSPTATLYPGGQAAVVLTASNPNPSPVHIGALALDTTLGAAGFAVDTDHSGCALSAMSFSTQTNAGSGWVVPATSGAVTGTLAITLANALSMHVDATNACQGGVFTVYLVANS
jgi:hypothetical protein